MTRLHLNSSFPISSEYKKHSLKVCLASWAPFVGGAEIALKRLAQGLKNQDHDVTIILGQNGAVKKQFEEAGLRCIYSPICFTDKWRWWRYLSARNQLKQLFRHKRPDIIHSNDLPTHQIISDAARAINAPRICHHRYPFSGSAINWFSKFGAEKHLFVSHALMDEMCRNSVSLQNSKRSVVYDGLPLPQEPTNQTRYEARHNLGLQKDKVIVIYAGQIIERKGIEDLLQAWALLNDESLANAMLVLVGDDLQSQGKYRQEMEKLADQLNCSARFFGFQNNIEKWLLASDIAVVPSRIEPLGNATLEAMSYSLPVVGCAVGGIPEMIVDNKTGLLVSPKSPKELAEALRSLIENQNQRQQLGIQGRVRCEELFSLNKHTEHVLSEYYSVLEENLRKNKSSFAASHK